MYIGEIKERDKILYQFDTIAFFILYQFLVTEMLLASSLLNLLENMYINLIYKAHKFIILGTKHILKLPLQDKHFSFLSYNVLGLVDKYWVCYLTVSLHLIRDFTYDLIHVC